MKVIAFVPDLMDRSKVRAAFPHVALVSRAEDLVDGAADAALVLVDLQRPGVLDALSDARAAGPLPRVVGFASHVDQDVLDSAAAVGVEALARSVFFRRLPTLAAVDQ